MAQTIQILRTSTNTPPATLLPGALSVELGAQTKLWVGATAGNRLLLSSDPADASAAGSAFLKLSGGTMTGQINLAALPTLPTHAAAKQYVDNVAATLLPLTGGTMLGPLVLAADPGTNLGAATKQYVDNFPGHAVVATAPPTATPGTLWFDSNGGQLYVRYDDGNSQQWVPSANIAGSVISLPLAVSSGGTGGTTAAQAATNLSVLPLTGGNITGSPGALGVGVTLPGDVIGGSIYYNGSLYSAVATHLTSNIYYSSGGSWKYIGNGAGGSFLDNGGAFQWFSVPSGTAGNTATLTTTMVLDASGNMTINGLLTTGASVSTAAAGVEVGAGRTGSGNAFIDLHAQTGTDYEARIMRNSGANGTWDFIQNGTGLFRLTDGGGTALFDVTTAPGSGGQFHVAAGYRAQSGVYGTQYANVFNIDWNGGAHLWIDNVNQGTINVTPSDLRLKTEVKPASKDAALTALRRIELVEYDLHLGEVTRHDAIGFTAQQLAEHIPEAVTYPDDKDAMLGVQLHPIVSHLIGAVQQMAARLDVLEGVR